METYVEQLKSAGFTYDANESKSPSMYLYSAYNSENILSSAMVQVNYSDDGRLSILMGKAR